MTHPPVPAAQIPDMVAESVPSTESPGSAAREQYENRMVQELRAYEACINVHELPKIFHYWSNKYLLPKLEAFGIAGIHEFFASYMKRACEKFPGEQCRFVSIGAGNGDLEANVVQQVLQGGADSFVLEFLELNPAMLERGRAIASERGLSGHMRFAAADINTWNPNTQHHVIMVNQSLHHFVELEELFRRVHDALHPSGYFLASDIIGRNGHMRWPEALAIVTDIWSDLPEKYKYNHLLRRVELQYDNWDCSTEGFEGIRAQDILPLLLQRFHFEFFFAFGNLIDIFVDRCFGHNFDPDREFDRSFIDRVHALDEQCFERGTLKPTHMIAAMTRYPVQTTAWKNLTPEFSVRWPAGTAS